MSGPIELTNLHKDPHCYQQRATWMGKPATKNGDKWRYEKNPDYNSGLWAWWHPNNGDLMLGKVLYARVYSATQAVLDNLVVEDATTLACQDGWIAAQVAENAGKSHSLPLKYGPLVLDEVAVYTPEDWEIVYELYQRGSLTRPWFAGDLLPAEAGGGYLFLSVIHMLTSLWGWRHERGRGDQESVCDAVRNAQNQLLVEYGCSAGAVRQMVIHDARRIAAEWHVRVPDGLQHENGQRRAGVRVLVRPARPDDRAAWHVAASHLGHGHDRGRSRFGADGLGGRTARGHERSARIVGASGRRMAHIGGLCGVQRGRLAAGAKAPRRRRPTDAVVRAAQGRAKRAASPNPVTALSAWVVAA